MNSLNTKPMINPTASTSKLDETPVVTIAAPGSGANLGPLSPAMIEQLSQLSSPLVFCLTLCACFFLSIRFMEQVNRFIELVKKR